MCLNIQNNIHHYIFKNSFLKKKSVPNTFQNTAQSFSLFNFANYPKYAIVVVSGNPFEAPCVPFDISSVLCSSEDFWEASAIAADLSYDEGVFQYIIFFLVFFSAFFFIYLPIFWIYCGYIVFNYLQLQLPALQEEIFSFWNSISTLISKMFEFWSFCLDPQTTPDLLSFYAAWFAAAFGSVYVQVVLTQCLYFWRWFREKWKAKQRATLRIKLRAERKTGSTTHPVGLYFFIFFLLFWAHLFYISVWEYYELKKEIFLLLDNLRPKFIDIFKIWLGYLDLETSPNVFVFFFALCMSFVFGVAVTHILVTSIGKIRRWKNRLKKRRARLNKK